MNDYSKKYDSLIKSVKDWQNTWASYLQFDEQYSDPNRFKNRNYSSLFEERERKRFNLELPKVIYQIFYLSDFDFKLILIFNLLISSARKNSTRFSSSFY